LKKIIYSHGEPAGIGPDIIIKLSKTKIWEKFKIPVIAIGDKNLFRDRALSVKKKIKIIEIDDLNKAKKNKIGVIQIYKVLDCNNFSVGKINDSNARYVLDNLNFCIKESLLNKNTALVTGPISKENIISFDKSFTGHTEHIKKMTNSDDVLMMLASEKLRVALATTHVALKDVPKKINQKLIINKIKILNSELKNKFGLKNPKIKVLGLNPHAGEAGSYGSEEIEHIKPAIAELNNQGLNLIGPIPADTAFIDNQYDAYLSMYHDQALPVLKTLDFQHSVNITLGLPFTRVSVDHGTAEDIAMDLVADYTSMFEALKLAGNGDNI